MSSTLNDLSLRLAGIAGRLLIAAVLTLIAAGSPALVTFIPGIGSLTRLSTSPLGSGPLGVAVMSAVTCVVCAVPTVTALIGLHLLMRTVDRGRRVDLGLRPDRRALAWTAAMVAVAIVILCLTAGVLTLLGLSAPVADPMTALPESARNWVRLPAAISMAFLFAAIPEETIWRGWFYSSAGSTRVAAVLSVLTFTVMHLMSSGGQHGLAQRFVYLIGTIGFATAAMAVREVSGSVWPAIGVHGGMLMAEDLLAHLLGVPRQPSTWVTVGFLWALVGVSVLVWNRWRQRGNGSEASQA
ncbi:CPBP family intramembrane metalloprotease [Schaalia sp. 19OD2882]|uniref:CPBP family intramembrane glutamic endopeptidase n=1 Tax=Schaalia sp. 19OD2882 TaxID=2794089 RepID=UPI001C1EE169|nr:CPBP family intramembrane glutamic endopeptidase [Schaalia sp. 19OD2882]QWW19651.1 CPBP family intramembrane metalloprotease [Schaalia sp. 19OD2882]